MPDDGPGDTDQRVGDRDGGFLLLPRPNRRATRRNRAPGRVAVRDTVHADSTSAVRRCWLPLRAAACLRLPADSLSPGASPAQAASRAGVANRAMSPPCLGHDHLRGAGADAGDRDQPGDDGGERLGRLGDQDVQLSDAGGEMIVGVQVQPDIWAWESLNRPSQAICSASILARSRFLARFASTPGLRSPAISASIMSRPDTPSSWLATESILIPASLKPTPL